MKIRILENLRDLDIPLDKGQIVLNAVPSPYNEMNAFVEIGGVIYNLFPNEFVEVSDLEDYTSLFVEDGEGNEN